MRLMKAIAIGLTCIVLAAFAVVGGLWFEMHRYAGGFSLLASVSSFQFRGATITLEREASRPFHHEFRRYIDVRGREGGRAKVEIRTDMGGSLRLLACEASGGTVVVSDPRLKIAYAIDTGPIPSVHALAGDPPCRNPIGEFDAAARGGYGFHYRHS